MDHHDIIMTIFINEILIVIIMIISDLLIVLFKSSHVFASLRELSLLHALANIPGGYCYDCNVSTTIINISITITFNITTVFHTLAKLSDIIQKLKENIGQNLPSHHN